MLQTNPYAFGAAGYGLGGPEQLLFLLFVKNCEGLGRIIRNTPEALIDAALANPGCRWARGELEEAFRNLQTGEGGKLDVWPLLAIDERGFVIPTDKADIREV